MRPPSAPTVLRRIGVARNPAEGCMLKDVHVVLRSVGERTARVARRLALAQLTSDADLTLVNEAPFEAALRATYLAGLRAGKKWTMTLDADVLLLPSAIVTLLAEAEAMPSHYFQTQGRVLDKITGTYRSAGPRVYRTELLRRAIEKIPEAGAELRPEFSVVDRLAKAGHPFRRVGAVAGLHDYEQSYGDLYRKSFVHAKKHAFLVSAIVQRCAPRLHSDRDFLAILKGAWDGLLYAGPVALDARKFEASIARALAELALEEKHDILDEETFVKTFRISVEEIIGKEPLPGFRTTDRAPLEKRPESGIEKVRERIKKLGVARGTAASFGGLLKYCGRLLDA